jgi:hypothetical protein
MYLCHCGRSIRNREGKHAKGSKDSETSKTPATQIDASKKGDPDLGEEAVWFMAAGMIWHGVSAAPAYSQDGTISKAVNITHLGSTLRVDLTA